MGYYVNGTSHNFRIKKENFAKGYELLCNLNSREDLKQRTLFSNIPTPKPKNSKSVASRPDYTFPWMDWNYDELDHELDEILLDIGFITNYDAHGDLIGLSFYNKGGNEDLFLDALAPVVENGSEIYWNGEDIDNLWKNEFKNGALIEKRGYIVYD